MTPLLQVSVLFQLFVLSSAWNLWTLPRVSPLRDTVRSAHSQSLGTNEQDSQSFSSSISYPATSSPSPLSRRSMVEVTANSIFWGGALVLGYPSTASAAYIDPATNAPTITDKVYLDVEWVNMSSMKTQGRITIGLYGQVMPKTVENFVTLCRQNAYAGTTFYRIISDYSIQGGAIGDTTESGKIGRSAFSTPSFEPDNYNIQHTIQGLVSMVRDASGGVDSRFFIQLQDDAGWADDRYAAFGIVLDNDMEVVKQLEKVPVQPPKNNPKQPVRIVASGVL